MVIFISHSSDSARQAVRFKELLKAAGSEAKIFLSSDWESIPAGSVWLQQIEAALNSCDYFVALIVKSADAERLWVNYEVGFIRGRGLLPKLLVFSGIPAEAIRYPLCGLQLLMHGDTNRWMLEFSGLGLKVTEELRLQFGALFEHRISE